MSREYGIRVTATGNMLKRVVGLDTTGDEPVAKLMLTEHSGKAADAPARWTELKAVREFADQWYEPCVVVKFEVIEVRHSMMPKSMI